MNSEQRERAASYAELAAGKIPNGPTAGDLVKAAKGRNEHLLLAIHVILEDVDESRARSTNYSASGEAGEAD
jgi:hypothetical protein